jgi:hypothetical protein
VKHAGLPDGVKADNIFASARVPRVLALVSLAVVSKDHPSTLPRATVLSIIEASLDLQARYEDDSWMELKCHDCWSRSPVRDLRPRSTLVW